LLSWDPIYTKEELPAVSTVGMLCEDSFSWRRTLEFTALIINRNNLAAAFRNLVNPTTTVLDLVISKARGAFISVSDSILAVPEDTTTLRISKCSIQAWTVCG
jgi:hypothetical protein